jgi:hypothetical protein
MAQRIELPIIGGSAPGRKDIVVNDQATVNLVTARKSQGAKAPFVLESAPGLIQQGSPGDGACRTPTMVSSKVRGSRELYGVYGTKLVAQAPGVVNTEVGTLNTSSGVVRIARGRDYVACVDGTDLYTYDGTTFATTTLPVGVLPTHIAYLDGFFHINDAATDNWYISALEDPTSVNALDFEAAAVTPDAADALIATESTLWVLGDESAQPYYNSGDVDFPYDLVLSGVQEKGILAPQSIAESDDGVFYLGTTPEGGRFIYQITGHSGRIVSTDEIDEFLTTIEDPTTAYGFMYQQAGKSFYVLQLGASRTDAPDPRDNWTLVYNIRAGVFEFRERSDGSAWRVSGHGILNNRNLGGSRLQAQQFELSTNTYTDINNERIPRRRRTQIYHVDNRLMDWWSLIVDVKAAVGNVSGSGNNPILKMRYSDDGGINWSAWLESPMGQSGDTQQRCVYNGLGQSRNRVFELEYDGPTAFTIIAAFAEVTILND